MAEVETRARKREIAELRNELEEQKALNTEILEKLDILATALTGKGVI